MEQVTNENFYEEVIKASFDYPVLVQFWAPWCGPCHGLTRTLEQIEDNQQFPVKFTGLDVDRFTDLALQFKIMGVPHTRIFVSGHPLDQFSDPLPAQEIELFLINALILPALLRYSHYSDQMETELVSNLENRADGSLRKEVYFLTLAKYYIFQDPDKSKQYLDRIPDESDQFEDRLFIRDLFPLLDTDFSPTPADKKLWAAKNAFLRKNFESTWQFLLQANRMTSDTQIDAPRAILMAFRRFLGPDHELNRKYHSQYMNLIGTDS